MGKMNLKKIPSLPPSMAWLTIFLPALSYVLLSRLNSTWSRSLGPAVTTTIEANHAHKLESVFFVSTQSSSQTIQQDAGVTFVGLQHALHLVLNEGLENVVSSVWRHDSELGRGYLLVSQSHSHGRIWRWEVGGGPIAIGKTLAMEPSGCRSQHFCPISTTTTTAATTTATDPIPQHGSGALAIDFGGRDHAQEGRLVVAEWGEGRIVRLEDTTGARTPLVIQLPDLAHPGHLIRVKQPTQMLYTPFGDLLVLVNCDPTNESSKSKDVHDEGDMNDEMGVAAIYRLKQAIHVPPLKSSMDSRRAHAWNATTHQHPMDVVYRAPQLGSMALDSTWTSLLVTVQQNDGSVLLMRMSILDEADEAEDHDTSEADSKDHAEESESDTMGLWKGQTVANLTEIYGVTSPPRAMVVDRKGHVFLAIPGGVLILDCSSSSSSAALLGNLKVPLSQQELQGDSATSLTLGDDGYLYITTLSQLLRIRVRNGPVVLPTNMLSKKSFYAA